MPERPPAPPPPVNGSSPRTGHAGESGDLREIAALDEILQVMYWLQGEGLAVEVAAEDLERWVGLAPAEIRRLLGRLAERGWVAERTGRHALTPRGKKEAGRRFADEFADLTRPGHGECGDPDCDCHATGRPEDCAHHQHRHP